MFIHFKPGQREIYKKMDSKDENIKFSENPQNIKPEISETPLSQLKLIKQWRTTLACLMKDVEFEKMSISEDEKLI